MRKFKLTKKDKKQIADLDKKMPVDHEPYMNYIMQSGKAIKTGKAKTISYKNGKFVEEKFVPGVDVNLNDLKDDKLYPVTAAQLRKINHKRRMIKLCEEGGWDAVVEYMSKYLTPETKEKMKSVAD